MGTATTLLAAGIYLVAYLVAVNLLTAFMFHLDKQRAIARGWRISESNLLFLALIGGTLGAKYAQRRFRHKTRKQPFAATLDVIGVLQIGLLLVLLFPAGRDQLLSALAGTF